MSQCLSRQFMNFLWKKKPNPPPPPPPGGRSPTQDKRRRPARSAVFWENSNLWTKIYTRLTWVVWLKKVVQQFYWLITFCGSSWGQSYLATPVPPQNCTKILRNLNFVVQFTYSASGQKNFFFVFSSHFLRDYGKLFRKSRATRGKP